jgi:predicted membrane protein
MNLLSKIGHYNLVIIIIASFFISLFYGKKKKYLFPIQVYIALSIVFGILMDPILQYFKIDFNQRTSSAETNIFSVLELSLFYYFLYGIVWGNGFRILMVLFYTSFVSISLFSWMLTDNGFYTYSAKLYGLENLLIIVPSLFYLYEILSSDMEMDFNKNPSFIVVCGILFYFSITVPIFLVSNILLKNTPALAILYNAINEFLFSLFFISFIKAFLCPSAEQKLS